jgi:hypothetical protein
MSTPRSSYLMIFSLARLGWNLPSCFAEHASSQILQPVHLVKSTVNCDVKRPNSQNSQYMRNGKRLLISVVAVLLDFHYPTVLVLSLSTLNSDEFVVQPLGQRPGITITNSVGDSFVVE